MTEVATITLTDFLLARIAEDEAGADQWHDLECDRHAAANLIDVAAHAVVTVVFCDCKGPQRWLADCAAKRQIIDLHGQVVDNPGLNQAIFCASCGSVEEYAAVTYPCDTLKLLALPYADHEDYRAEWRLA